MGLFGKSLEEKVNEAVASVKSKVAGVRSLEAKIAGNVVTLSGEVDTMEAKAGVMREFNAAVETENTVNAVRVAAPAAIPTPASQTAPRPSERIHEVAKGETLSGIAKHYYGKASLYIKIFEANRDVLKDPDKIFPGQRLKIPE